ncbi:MAG TPA: hypothetical protein VHE55_07100 [Fimbriimonadaceae bacterium]|nr:hypothetical protein [Fimbriimonadaceae bacterium]
MRIDLISREGVRAGSVMELRRTADGAVTLQVLSESEAGDPSPVGTTSLVAFARALAKKSRLKLETFQGYYSLQRQLEWVDVEQHSFESEESQFWKVPVGDILAALKGLSRRAA